MTRAARIRNRIDRQNGYDADWDEDDGDVPTDFLEGWSSTMAQHAEEEGKATATAEAPGLFRRRLAGLVVINGAMVDCRMEQATRKTRRVNVCRRKFLAHISVE